MIKFTLPSALSTWHHYRGVVLASGHLHLPYAFACYIYLFVCAVTSPNPYLTTMGSQPMRRLSPLYSRSPFPLDYQPQGNVGGQHYIGLPSGTTSTTYISTGATTGGQVYSLENPPHPQPQPPQTQQQQLMSEATNILNMDTQVLFLLFCRFLSDLWESCVGCSQTWILLGIISGL